jgi:hypothetical protein
MIDLPTSIEVRVEVGGILGTGVKGVHVNGNGIGLSGMLKMRNAIASERTGGSGVTKHYDADGNLFPFLSFEYCVYLPCSSYQSHRLRRNSYPRFGGDSFNF